MLDEFNLSMTRHDPEPWIDNGIDKYSEITIIIVDTIGCWRMPAKQY